MKIAVTGASGHLGNVLCRQLLDQGHQVRALYRSDKTALEGLDVNVIQGDVLDQDLLNDFVSGCEVVFHSAAKISIHGDPDGSVWAINTCGPENVVKACVARGVKKVIHVSSTHAVEEYPLDSPMIESRAYKTGPTPVYDYSKAVGEQVMLKAFGRGVVEGCVVRPSSIVGPFDFKPSELGKALLDMRAEKVPVLPPGGYDFVDVRDVVEAMIQAIDHGRNGEVYFLTGRYKTIKELAALVGECTGAQVPKRVLPFWFMNAILPLVQVQSTLTKAAPVFTKESIAALKYGHPDIDSSKASIELKLQRRPLNETIADFFTWRDTIKLGLM